MLFLARSLGDCIKKNLFDKLRQVINKLAIY